MVSNISLTIEYVQKSLILIKEKMVLVKIPHVQKILGILLDIQMLQLMIPQLLQQLVTNNQFLLLLMPVDLPGNYILEEL